MNHYVDQFTNQFSNRKRISDGYYQATLPRASHTTSTHVTGGSNSSSNNSSATGAHEFQHVVKGIFLNMNKIYNDILMVPWDKFKNDPIEPSLIIDPYLYLGGIKSIDVKVLKRLGITHVLTAAREIQLNTKELHSAKIATLHIPATDGKGYNMLEQFKLAFEFIDKAKHAKGKVIIHCARGISRSATLVIAYLMYRYNMRLKKAYNYVKSCRPKILPNRLFMLQLKQFEYELYSMHHKQQQQQQQQSQKKFNFKFL
jgi:protein-tyrosine phosphatase